MLLYYIRTVHTNMLLSAYCTYKTHNYTQNNACRCIQSTCQFNLS